MYLAISLRVFIDIGGAFENMNFKPMNTGVENIHIKLAVTRSINSIVENQNYM